MYNKIKKGGNKMKKLLYIFVASIIVLGSTKQAYAVNMVSEMAVNKGGQSVAECARTMDKGVSECAKAEVCAE
jgi:hypothetical protein